jgi:hypothetical protein
MSLYVFLYEVTIYLSYNLQIVVFGPKQLQQFSSNVSELFVTGATNVESYGSRKVGPSFANSKGFFMFSTVNTSSIVDFSRATIDEGIIDNPPNKEIG